MSKLAVHAEFHSPTVVNMLDNDDIKYVCIIENPPKILIRHNKCLP